MTDQRASADPYTTRFETRVEAIDGRTVTLDRTYFYAESGGQPADRGTLGGVAVEDVQRTADGVVHTLAEPPGFAVGDDVACEVDDGFRTYCMRAHTASHALYGAGRELLDELGYGGFDISPEKVRVDFETTTEIDDDVLLDLERRVNEVVWDSRPVAWETLSKEDALEREGIAFNTKTEEGVLAGSDTVRVVEIEGWDVAACGGTHVSNTREIGPVTVLGRSNPGEGLTRVEFAVGPESIERRADERRATLAAARELGTNVASLPDEVSRLQDDVAALEAELEDARTRLVDARIAELRQEVVERDGRTWLVGEVEGLDANALGERAKELAGDVADVVVLVGRDGATFLAVGAGREAQSAPDRSGGDEPRENGIAAGDVVADVTDEFGGGGGGSPSFAQGGGLDASPDAVVDYLR